VYLLRAPPTGGTHSASRTPAPPWEHHPPLIRWSAERECRFPVSLAGAAAGLFWARSAGLNFPHAMPRAKAPAKIKPGLCGGDMVWTHIVMASRTGRAGGAVVGTASQSPPTRRRPQAYSGSKGFTTPAAQAQLRKHTRPHPGRSAQHAGAWASSSRSSTTPRSSRAASLLLGGKPRQPSKLKQACHHAAQTSGQTSRYNTSSAQHAASP
jgi:hypothetical protein